MITISSQTFGGVYMKYGKRLLALVLAASLFTEPTLPAQASARSSKTSHKASTAATVKRMRILRVKKEKLRASDPPVHPAAGNDRFKETDTLLSFRQRAFLCKLEHLCEKSENQSEYFHLFKILHCCQYHQAFCHGCRLR